MYIIFLCTDTPTTDFRIKGANQMSSFVATQFSRQHTGATEE